jgi:hypothetical protein
MSPTLDGPLARLAAIPARPAGDDLTRRRDARSQMTTETAKAPHQTAAGL